jgi:GAF domain-containing protein
MKNFSSRNISARPFSLRTRLILGNMIIIFLAVTGLGYYVYYRAQEANSYLTAQLTASVRQQAETQMNAIGTEQAAALDNFFATAAMNITMVGATASNLVSQENSLNNGIYWNAVNSLSRLPNGSWDNSKADAASVFVPAKYDLTPNLVSELNTIRQLDFTIPTVLKSNPDVVAIYFGGVSGETVYYPNIDLASLVPPDFDVTQRPWFLKASPAQDPSRQAVWSDPYLDAASHGLIVTSSAPVYDSNGTFRGVVAMDFQLNKITEVVSGIHVGNTGYSFLIDKNHRLIALPAAGYKEFGISASAVPLGQLLDPTKVVAPLPPEFWQILGNMSSGKSGFETIQLNGVEHFVAYRPVPSIGYSLALIVPSQELLASAAAAQAQIAQSARNTILVSLFIVIAILIISLLATLGISSRLMQPLGILTRTAEEIAHGDLNAEAHIQSQDEIGTLAATLNSMTASLRESIQSLEQRVAERTSELELVSRNANRRAAEFEAIVQVTGAISSIRRMEELLPRITSVISEQFGYYHVGIFLNNETDRYTYLTAANSEGGQKMLNRGHNLKIGEQGIVGNVASTGKPRMARNVGEDAVFFNNPDLPETKSELALPLRSGGNIIGVLDVQSREPDAFSEEDIRVLTILADQVSLAIENVRSFETTQRALNEAEALYRQYLRQAWSRLPREQRLAGYRYTPRGASILETQVDLSSAADAKEKPVNRITVPIKLRGEVIGELNIQIPADTKLSNDHMDLIQAVADRLALSAENARLFDETSRRAERERLVTEITSKIRSTNDPETMIKTALNELRNALGATQVQLIPQAISISQGTEKRIYSSTAESSTEKAPGGNGAQI